ncbi:MAG: nucleotidyltransferase domain-containing protein [Methylobacter sp.]|uniref:Nucleotidyltransferase domain-containing protein n=1 Tax=Candidatus Methylobacter titanis TaxID=3053457 RepID=A0AA43Q6U7_9GAMM|nr:nucleotidyltransferase domain-containing protein [Candidatus Methylobacter titanis]
MMDTGLTQTDIGRIIAAIKQFPEIEETIIFGSRVKGNYKKASDVDLAIKGHAVTGETIKRLSFLLNEELPLPYFFDVVHYESLENQLLIEHIDRVGKPITFFDRA